MITDNTPKLGLSTSCLFPLGVKSTFSAAKELGYDGIELMITGDKKTRDIDYLKMLQDKYQLPILSVHAPTLIATHFVWGTDPKAKLRKTVELTKELGAETIVVHPPFVHQKEYANSFIQNANELGEELNANVAIENMFPWKVNGKNRAMYAPSWGEIKAKANALTFDFSHASLSGINTIETVTKNLEKIKHFHICDGLGTKPQKRTGEEKEKLFDEHLLPGEGNQPILEVFQILKTNNWKGHLVAEVKTSNKMRFEKKLAYLETTLNYMKKYADL